MATIDLACIGSAWCPVQYPTTNYHGAKQYALAGTSEGAKPYYTYLLLKFEDLPQQYKYNSPVYAKYHITANKNLPTGKTVGVAFRALTETFDEETVTYDTVPRTVSGWYGVETISSGTGDEDLAWTANTRNTTAYLETNHCAVQALQSGAVAVYCSDAVTSGYLKAYTENETSSGKRPYLTVAIGDSPLYVDTKITTPEHNTLYNTEEALEISWDLVFSSYEGLMPIVQTSAVLEWRVQGSEDEWNEINISGDVRSVTIPANTFPARNIEFWVRPTIVGYNISTAYRAVNMRRFVDTSPSGIAWIQQSSPDTPMPWSGSGSVSYISGSLTGSAKKLLLAFSPNYSDFAHKALGASTIVFDTFINEHKLQGVYLYFLSSAMDSDTVTWNTQPAVGRLRGSARYDNRENDRYCIIRGFYLDADAFETGEVPSTTRRKSELAAELLTAPGFRLDSTPTVSDQSSSINSFYISDPVKLRAFFLDLTVTSKPQASTYASGYVNRHISQTFAWDLVPDGDYVCLGSWEQESATFFYRAGTSGDWTSVEISGSEQSVTIAADTLAAGTVQWKVETTDTEGTTAESEVYEINTTDSTTTATPIAPKETIENGQAPIRFIWETANDNATAPTGADLQKSNDGSNWTTFAQITDAGVTEYDAPVGTFSSGTRYWRVRAYNADGVAGAWSDPVTFVVVAAPPAPVVSADGKPYATITWQSSGQMAYRVTVDGTSYGPYFGTAKSFETPDFLSDGSHTASVEVQGEAGLWSQPGSVTFSVTNIPGEPISLTGKFGRDAELTWSTEAAVSAFYVYRDGVRIGRTGGTRFSDRFVLGEHEYYVINKLPGGYYTRSNLATGTMRSCTRAVAAFAGGSWLEMALSDESDTEENFSWSAVVSERYVTGSDLPVVETSPYRSGTGSYKISFKDVETGAAFEALRGRKIIVKSRGGNVAIGVLSGYQKTMTNFYINYSFSVKSCSWEDFVDET